MNSTKNALNRMASTWPKDQARPNLQISQLLHYIAERSVADVSPRTIAAVRALQDDRLMSKYALTSRTTEPASYPQHYHRTVKGYDDAIRGKKRTLLQTIFGSYK
ncbi:hypothetical protein FRB94_014130 [Tulasnella sp. JGI-2019a]|nr:hypothetical protein FRB94_014130 [Tulasnella sp. JGI-2019a]KAG8991902.1 hypothetical protein FRB93_002522 [Tulasnella sp. JGI-2019a]